MDKKIAALLGAAAGWVALGSAQAATPPAPATGAAQASSYADLLAPIANASTQLRAEQAAPPAGGGFKLAQYYYYYGPRRWWYHHHHHHHHHHRFWFRY